MPRKQKDGKKFPSQSLESRRAYVQKWKLEAEVQTPKVCHRKADCLNYLTCLEREAMSGDNLFDCPTNCVEYRPRPWDYHSPHGLEAPFEDSNSIGAL